MSEVLVIFDPKNESYLVEIPAEPGDVTMADIQQLCDGWPISWVMLGVDRATPAPELTLAGKWSGTVEGGKLTFSRLVDDLDPTEAQRS